MSLFQTPPTPPPPPAIPLPPQESNALGVVGFVCAMVGFFFTGGLLCPIGLVLSLVALGRQPRGFAIAGVVVGLFGTCGFGLVVLFAGAAILAALGIAVAAVALSEPEKVEITSDMINMVIAVKAYEEEHRYLPADLDTLDLKATTRTDPWGSPYAYHLRDEDPGFEVESEGADGTFGTTDDVRLSSLGETWHAGGFGVEVSEADDEGRVRIKLGDRTITATGDEDGGRITLDMGDRVIEIVGDEDGAAVNVGSGDSEREDELEEDEASEDADEEAPPDGDGG